MIFCPHTALTSYSIGHLLPINSLFACDVALSGNKTSIRVKVSINIKSIFGVIVFSLLPMSVTADDKLRFVTLEFAPFIYSENMQVSGPGTCVCRLIPGFVIAIFLGYNSLHYH